MFIRKRKNRSGSTSIVVINKRYGQFVEVKHFGTAETEEDVNRLYGSAQKWLMTNGLTERQKAIELLFKLPISEEE